jgi:hypothetical protein
MGNVPVYVISLRDSVTRRRNMTERLGALGIPFQFVDAIDGRTQRVPDEFNGAQVIRDAFQSEAEIACAMSHRLVHRMIAEDTNDLALILEDDAVFQPDFPETLVLAMTLRFDVLKFWGGPHGRRIQLGEIGKYRVMGGTGSLGAVAYLITRTAAARCCGLALIDQASDLIFSDLRLGLRVLDLEPNPVGIDTMPSDVGERHFSFHKARLGRLAQFALSVRKRAMFVRLYGLRATIAMDLKKIIGNMR